MLPFFDDGGPICVHIYQYFATWNKQILTSEVQNVYMQVCSSEKAGTRTCVCNSLRKTIWFWYICFKLIV